VGLRRHATGLAVLHASAHYVVSALDHDRQARISIKSARFTIVDAADPQGAEQPVRAKEKKGEAGSYEVTLPDVHDGDWLLRARVKTRLDTTTVEAPLALYVPARIHVITDRPLYRPGDTIQFRAVALGAKDLAPLEKRPGKWLVVDPS